MPALEYLLLADYVRQDGNLVHIMAAGLDTFYIPEALLPAGIPVGASRASASVAGTRSAPSTTSSSCSRGPTVTIC